LSKQRGTIDAQCCTSAVWFLPVESLLGEMDRTGVDRAVLVQFEGEIDNEYQFEVVRRYPGRFANVVALNYDQVDASSKLADLSRRGACGLRLPANVRGDLLGIWKAAGELNLSISCFGNATEYFSDDFTKLIQSNSHVPVVLEHAGGAYGYNAPIEDLKKVMA
jgi:L-fuconolactonase